VCHRHGHSESGNSAGAKARVTAIVKDRIHRPSSGERRPLHQFSTLNFGIPIHTVSKVQVFPYIVIALAAYLLGSIPTGFLVTKARGIDIRTVGSGNIGATNAFRILGTGPGILVLLVDALKGWTAVQLLGFWMVPVLLPASAWGRSQEVPSVLAGLFVILGHNFTCWLGFKGGKGIATSGGVFFALAPVAAAIALGAWVIVFFLTRYVSLASLVASIMLPTAVWLTVHGILVPIVTTLLGFLAVFKHRGNIRRLLDRTESRVQFKKKEAAP
jgi:acyl phosphate:glycerol-3-phosphate acyltransferase